MLQIPAWLGSDPDPIPRSKSSVKCQNPLASYLLKYQTYLDSFIYVLLAQQALLDPDRALAADGDVAARQKENVAGLVAAHHALVQTQLTLAAVHAPA